MCNLRVSTFLAKVTQAQYPPNNQNFIIYKPKTMLLSK